MHHPELSEVYQPRRVGMVHEIKRGELLARAAFMLHADEGLCALKHYATLKGLSAQVCHLYTQSVLLP